MVTKKKLREALNKSNIAYDILQTKYNDLNEQYKEALDRITYLEKEFFKIQNIQFSPLLMKVNKILSEKRPKSIFTQIKYDDEKRV